MRWRRTTPSSAAGTPTKIVANLPYNIATPLLIGWLGNGAMAAVL